MRSVRKCKYCGDEIYAFQKVTKPKGEGKYHEGCWNIKQKEDGK